MNTFKKPRWLIRESNVTNEDLYFNRREFIKKSSFYLGSSAITYSCLSKYGTASQNNINNFKFIKNNNIKSPVTFKIFQLITKVLENGMYILGVSLPKKM